MASLSFSVVMSGIRTKFSSVDQMSTDELASVVKDGNKKLLLLDTRPISEFQVSHLDSAVHVNTDGVETAVELVREQEPDLIVCYCSLGYRSSDFASRLKKIDEVIKCPVYNLEGSLFKWANEDRPMVDNNGQATKFAHPYNSLWGKLLRHELRKTEI